ncbi:hypothetical protein PoB_006568000 [Plakobranchus ocellatus]|uniref:Uncharacterized protein n=1 Tax=Plakobranchus ocellatus TaxID=259542 RepID=A0AAV4D4U2_9GAST|nr:hypothetical protein PoB_006568000 [Plakobranchus ocellatus]
MRTQVDKCAGQPALIRRAQNKCLKCLSYLRPMRGVNCKLETLVTVECTKDFTCGHMGGRYIVCHTGGKYVVGHVDGKYMVGHKGGKYVVGHMGGKYVVCHIKGNYMVGHMGG